ncbi:class I SAM-dependent methyltransferase [Gloeocapsopsis sp. IPPAS B-1203]|uniref:methyltransferase n=1 Tax=Gloeocapsopsis sp. IPPAS B-1203 TaxID=2049454 RepID=UPI0025A112CF|nr:class I SAM-dependent methyltransferase [Gloeocapsopsis sp. IPPAS B-1203]
MIPTHLYPLYQSITQNPPYGWFPSSPDLIERMLKLATITLGMRGLDPSAGSGALACAMRERGAVVDAIEIDPNFQILLKQQGFNLVGTDFLTTEPQTLYDIILANPPFSDRHTRGVDLEHIQRAFHLFLAPGGHLVTVVSASMNCKNCPRARAFRAFLQRIDAQVEELPLEIFWQSDRPVTVESFLISARKLPLHAKQFPTPYLCPHDMCSNFHTAGLLNS